MPKLILCRGEGCPGCTKSKVVRVRGMAPLHATLYAREMLRCSLCGEMFTAPEGVGDKKYDEAATSMIALLKYGTGLPFNRIEKLPDGLGIPMPAATQWDVYARPARGLDHDERGRAVLSKFAVSAS